MKWLLLCFVGMFTLMFSKNVLNWAFSMENYFVHKKRLKQLQFEKNIEELISSLSNPVGKYIIPKLKNINEEKIQTKLDFSGWNKYFSAKNFIAFDLTLKIVAVIFFILLASTGNTFIGVIWGGILSFALNFFVDNKIDAKKEKIFSDFPNFLRVTQGFLSSGMPFIPAIEKTLPYVNEVWQELLKNLIIDFKTYNIETALDNLKNTTNTFEIKEFVILIKLILENGGSVKDGFESQTESIAEMQQFLLEKKIAKRKTLGILVQAPAMLCIFVTFGLPIVGDMTAIGLF